MVPNQGFSFDTWWVYAYFHKHCVSLVSESKNKQTYNNKKNNNNKNICTKTHKISNPFGKTAQTDQSNSVTFNPYSHPSLFHVLSLKPTVTLTSP